MAEAQEELRASDFSLTGGWATLADFLAHLDTIAMWPEPPAFELARTGGAGRSSPQRSTSRCGRRARAIATSAASSSSASYPLIDVVASLAGASLAGASRRALRIGTGVSALAAVAIAAAAFGSDAGATLVREHQLRAGCRPHGPTLTAAGAARARPPVRGPGVRAGI